MPALSPDAKPVREYYRELDRYANVCAEHKEAHRHSLGNRSALERLVDQLRDKMDERSGIVRDPNAAFHVDEAGLTKRVSHVSVEIARTVEVLPHLRLPEG